MQVILFLEYFIFSKSKDTFKNKVPHIYWERSEFYILIEIQYSNNKSVFSYKIEIRVYRIDNDTFPFEFFNESLHYKIKSKTGIPSKIFSRKEYSIDFGEDIKKSEFLSRISSSKSVLELFDLIDKKLLSPQYKEAIDGLKLVLNTDMFYFSTRDLKNEKAFNNFDSRVIHFSIREEIYKLLLSRKSNFF